MKSMKNKNYREIQTDAAIFSSKRRHVIPDPGKIQHTVI